MGGEACARHPRRASLTVCVSCGQAVCRECLVTTRVGVKCADCSGATAARRAGRRQPSRRRVVLAVGVAAVLVVAGVALAAMRGGDSPRAASSPSPGDDGPRSEEVAFTGAEGFTLRGTLDLPHDAGDRGQPGVVVAPGLGATTREGVLDDEGRVDALYADLGETLARNGFVVLRYDKRGTGGSAPLPAGSETVFDHHVEDLAAALELLGDREEVDPSRLGVVGHDQGGLAAMRVVADGGSQVDALALVATPGRPLPEAVADEIRDGFFAGGEEGEQLAAEFTDAVDELLATGEVPEVSERLQPILPAESAAFLTSIFSLDPAALAGDVDVPVLVVRGEHDPGVREHDVEALRDALTAAPAVEVLRVPDAGSTLADLSPGDDHAGDAAGEPHAPPETQGHPEAVAPSHPRHQDALRRLAQWLESALDG